MIENAIICVFLAGAALTSIGMLRDDGTQEWRPKRHRVHVDRSRRRDLIRITAGVIRRDRRRGRYGWKA